MSVNDLQKENLPKKQLAGKRASTKGQAMPPGKFGLRKQNAKKS